MRGKIICIYLQSLQGDDGQMRIIEGKRVVEAPGMKQRSVSNPTWELVYHPRKKVEHRGKNDRMWGKHNESDLEDRSR